MGKSLLYYIKIRKLSPPARGAEGGTLMLYKKMLAAVLCAVLLLTMTACGDGLPDGGEQISLVPIATAEQKEYSLEDMVSIYNAAVQKVLDAESYHMVGSVNSTAVMGEVMATVVTSIDCSYQLVDGKPAVLMNAVMHSDGVETPHSTYIADGKYYFDVYDLKYFTDSNDFGDYDAKDYLKVIDTLAVQEWDIIDEVDGGMTIQFTSPFGSYESDAVAGWLGGLVSEKLDLQFLTIKLKLSAAGEIEDFYMSFSSSVDFGGDLIEQVIVLNLNIEGYNATTVTAPADLAEYENWISDSEGMGDDHHAPGPSPEDVE